MFFLMMLLSVLLLLSVLSVEGSEAGFLLKLSDPQD